MKYGINYEPLIHDLKCAGITVIRQKDKADTVICSIGQLHEYLISRPALPAEIHSKGEASNG